MNKKLSELMREGAKKTKKAIHFFHNGHGDACALGAVGDAIGAVDKVLSEQFFFDNFPKLSEFVTNEDWDAAGVPEEVKNLIIEAGMRYDGNVTLYTFITTLNDYTDMTREQIADFLEERFGL